MRRYFLIFGLLFLLLFRVEFVFADSPYVLPYPSAMPGSIWYKFDLVKEILMKYWHFGDFGRFDYNLKESDKYLVEAKTLFEYKQYLLGYNALIKSNAYFLKIPPTLNHAQKSGKKISEKLAIIQSASRKHIEVLEKMRKDSPAVFKWSPEKGNPSVLDIGHLIFESEKIRKI